MQCKPDFVMAHSNLGNVLQEQGKFEEAVACYQRALHCKPDFAEAHGNLSMLWLLLDQYEKGWSEYEWRLRTKEFRTVAYQQPFWDGAARPEGTLLLHAEQGMGDALHHLARR